MEKGKVIVVTESQINMNLEVLNAGVVGVVEKSLANGAAHIIDFGDNVKHTIPTRDFIDLDEYERA